ncbi:MAG: hypothetical protein ACLFTK_17855 [Anaerolineales bacterium]
MEPIRDLVDALGITPDTFDYFVLITIIVGGVWAVIRLYRDLTGPPREVWQERQQQAEAED